MNLRRTRLRFLVERIITLLASSPLDAEHVAVLKSKHQGEREMLRQLGSLTALWCPVALVGSVAASKQPRDERSQSLSMPLLPNLLKCSLTEQHASEV